MSRAAITRASTATCALRALRRSTLAARCVCLCAALVGCGNADQGSGVAPSPSLALFEREVYPQLLRDCAFSDCHGKAERFFQVYGPGRTRLLANTLPGDPPTPDELMRSYDRARAMLASSARPEDSLLLRKPLESSQGGQGHKGNDSLGRNVYRYREDPSYALLLRWASSTSADDGQVANGAAGTGTTP